MLYLEFCFIDDISWWTHIALKNKNKYLFWYRGAMSGTCPKYNPGKNHPHGINSVGLKVNYLSRYLSTPTKVFNFKINK